MVLNPSDFLDFFNLKWVDLLLSMDFYPFFLKITLLPLIILERAYGKP
jgi:hypothetical protein